MFTAAGEIHPGQHDQELLSTEPVDELEGAQPLAQHIGDVTQHRIATVVTELVVDPLEPVDIAEQQADRLAGQLRLLGELVESWGKRVAVEEAGERVQDRLVAMMQLGRLHRPHDRDQADQQREARQHRHRVMDCLRRRDAEGAPDQQHRDREPTITTCGRKRAATIVAGSTIHGSAGLCGPPLIATLRASIAS